MKNTIRAVTLVSTVLPRTRLSQNDAVGKGSVGVSPAVFGVPPKTFDWRESSPFGAACSAHRPVGGTPTGATGTVALLFSTPWLRLSWFLMAVVAFFVLTPQVRTQAPAGVLVGPTVAASLRNAAMATRDQASAVGASANICARNASSANYRPDQFAADFNTLQLLFQTLRDRFYWMASLAFQMNRPQAGNALAELDAGLDIISELFVFLEQQFAAGTLDRATLVRTCRTLQDVMRQWQAELRRSGGQFGAIL